MRRLLIAVVIVWVFSFGQSVCAQSPRTSPTRAAEKFYRTYLKLKINGLPNDDQLKILSPLITSDLKTLFVTARQIQAKYIQEHPDEKPPWADGDLFSSLFEGAQSYRIGRATHRGDIVEVPVQLEYEQGGSTTLWSDVLVLVRRGNRWLVSDILLKGEWAFKSGGSLRSILSSR
ncbi:MAG TPA: hypothetical protein VFH31_10390 [Pyrinomonadaceae bacterium]|nr:hypothetical protein [Pyrinomonadaceae bacterium]